MTGESVAIIVVRAVFFAAAMATFGTALFPLYAVRRVDREETARRIRPLLFGASFLALLSALCWLALVIVDFGGMEAATFVSTAATILFETDFGPVWLVRLAVALLLVFVAASRLPPVATLALATVVLASQAWVGHSATGGPIHRTMQIVHLLSAGAWLGGLLPLAQVVRQIAQERASDRHAQRILLRFSAMGMVSVGLIIVTGVFNTWFVIGRIPNFSEEYDDILLLKIALVLGMVAVAIFNRLRLLPQLANANPRSPVLRQFWQSVLLEQALAVAVLLAASMLGRTNPQAW